MAIGIYVFGHGGGVPNGRAGNTNFAIIPDLKPESTAENVLQTNKYWLLDVGPETMLRITGCLDDEPSTQNLEGIILTHLHADHAGGLPSLAWRFRFMDKRKPILAVPRDLRSILRNQTAELIYDNPKCAKDTGHFPSLHDFFQNKALAQSETRILAENLTCLSFPVDHNIHGDINYGELTFPAYGIHLTIGDKKITFSGDTATVIDPHWFTSSDLVFHDVQFYNYGDGYHVHVPYAELRDAVAPHLRSKVYLSHTLIEPPKEAFDLGFRWASKGTLVTLY